MKRFVWLLPLLLSVPAPAHGQQAREYLLDTAPAAITAGGTYRIYQTDSSAPAAHTISINTPDSVILVLEKLNVAAASTPLHIEGGARTILTLKGGSRLVSANGAAIRISGGSHLAVFGSLTDTLIATGTGNTAIGAAQGGDTCGSIYIAGGFVKTTGGIGAAAAGRYCASVSIAGGIVETAGSIGARGGRARCGAVRISGGIVEADSLSGNRVFISGGSVKISRGIAGEYGDPQDADQQRVYLGILPNASNVAAVWVDSPPYNSCRISANHSRTDSLFLYLRHSGSRDDIHLVYFLLKDGRLFYDTARWASNRFTFSSASRSPYSRRVSRVVITSRFDTTYCLTPPRCQLVVFGSIVDVQNQAASAPLNSADFNEYVVKLNGQIRSRTPIANNTLPTFSPLYVDTRGIAAGRYPLSIEYGGSKERLPCRLDTFVTIKKTLPPEQTPTEREVELRDTLRNARPPLAPYWQWLKPDSIMLLVGRHPQPALYHHPDTNYLLWHTTIPVLTNKKPYPAPRIDSLYARYGDTLKHAAPPLPDGWRWVFPDTIIDTIGVLQIYTAQFPPPDTDIYRTNATNPVIIVSKGKPNPPLPQNLRAGYGDMLSAVALDTGWRWETPNARVGNMGFRWHRAIFALPDTIHYDTIMRRLRIEVRKTKEFIKVIMPRATEATDSAEYYFVMDSCRIGKDTAHIRFDVPHGVQIYAEGERDTIPSAGIILPMPKPNVYEYMFTISAPDTFWSEMLVIERPLALTNVANIKQAGQYHLIFANSNPHINGGYRFESHQWFCADTLLPIGSPYFIVTDTAAIYRAAFALRMPDNRLRTIRTCPSKLNIKPSASVSRLLAYPNPAPRNTSITFEIPPELKGSILILEVKIYDMLGALKEVHTIDAASPHLPLYLPEGAYIIHTNAGEVRLVISGGK